MASTYSGEKILQTCTFTRNLGTDLKINSLSTFIARVVNFSALLLRAVGLD